MSTMIEKVARAIYDVSTVEGVTLPWERANKGARDMHIEWARAAIEAMMEPTGAMEDVVERYCNFPRGHHHGAPLVKQIIRAALKEEGQ